MPDTINSTASDPFYNLLVSMGAAPARGTVGGARASMLDAYRQPRTSGPQGAGDPQIQASGAQTTTDNAIDSDGDSNTSDTGTSDDNSPDVMQAHVDLLSHILRNGPQDGEAPKDYLARQASSIQDLADSGNYDDPSTSDEDTQSTGDEPVPTEDPETTEELLEPDPDPGGQAQTKTNPPIKKSPSPPLMGKTNHGPIEIGFQTPDGKAPGSQRTLAERFAMNAARHLGHGQEDCKEWIREVAGMTGIQSSFPPVDTVAKLWSGLLAKNPHFKQLPNDGTYISQPGDLICTDADKANANGHLETVLRAKGGDGVFHLYRASASQDTRNGEIRNRLAAKGTVGCSEPTRHSRVTIFRLVEPSQR